MRRALPTLRDLRGELSELHHRLGVTLQKELLRTVPEGPEGIETYQAEYERSVDVDPKPASWRRFLREAQDTQLLYLADYHTLPDAQLASIEVARRVLGRRRPLAIALEMVQARHQESLDRFLSGELTEAAFLRKIDYDRTWGFAWDTYRDVLRFARKHQIPAVAINSDLRRKDGHLRRRDRLAARIITRWSQEHPESCLLVLCGELHLAENHLPADVSRNLQRLEIPRRQLILYQNSEQVFWKVAERWPAGRTEIFSLGPRKFCLLSAPPIRKLHSQLHWHEAGHPGFGDDVDYAHWISWLAHVLAEFFDIDPSLLDEFVAYSADEPDLDETLSAIHRISKEQIRDMKAACEIGASSYDAPSRLALLGRPDLNHLAWLASAVLCHRLESGGRITARTPRLSFYRGVLQSAFAHLGTKLVNPFVRSWSVRFFERYLSRNRGQRLTVRGAQVREVGRSVLRHSEFEKKRLSGGTRALAPRSLYTAAPQLRIETQRALGDNLGLRLYRALLMSAFDRFSLVERWREWAHGTAANPESFYFELLSATQIVD
ncbi:MAG: ChaN family lipoprotein [Planctomycetota bacterium]